MLNIENGMKGRREGSGGKDLRAPGQCRTFCSPLADQYPWVPGSPMMLLGNDSLGQFCNADVALKTEPCIQCSYYLTLFVFVLLQCCVFCFLSFVQGYCFCNVVWVLCVDGSYVLVCLLSWLLITPTVASKHYESTYIHCTASIIKVHDSFGIWCLDILNGSPYKLHQLIQPNDFVCIMHYLNHTISFIQYFISYNTCVIV